jgi:AraC-like DNA-binding protein
LREIRVDETEGSRGRCDRAEICNNVREAACEAIEAQHTTAVRLAEIATIVGFSPGQFSRAFRVSAGLTFTEYVSRMRLESAMRLMIDTDDSLYDIAHDAGFSDQSMFSRSSRELSVWHLSLGGNCSAAALSKNGAEPRYHFRAPF